MARKRRGVGRKKSSVRARPSPLPYLPMDAWAEVLIRTPVKDLVRFKRVCKAWYELISRRSFAESHAEHWRSRPVSRILFDVHSPVGPNRDIFYSSNINHRGSITRPDRRKGNYTVRCRNLLTRRQREEMGCGSKDLRVHASCDGLILIRYEDYTPHQLMIICNPVTGSYKKLPVFRPTVQYFRPWYPSRPPRYEWTMLRTGLGQYKVCGIAEGGSLSGRGMERGCCFLELQIGTKGQPEHRMKELMAPLSDEWSIKATTTKDGKVYWLATRPLPFADNHGTMKVLSLDTLKEEFSASVSVGLRLCQLECWFFPWKGAFYHTVHDTGKSCSLWVLEDFDTMTWTECGNFQLSNYDFLYLPGECPVIGDNKLLLGSYVFDLISKKFWRLGIDARDPPGRINVLHTDSLIGWCN